MNIHQFCLRKEDQICGTHPLELIIRSTPHVLMRILHNRHHPLRRLPLIQPQRIPIPQPLYRALTFETGQTRIEHELHGADKLFCMGSDGEECFDGELLEEGVALRVATSHEHDHFVVQLEG